jgi:hypothetical protein
LELRVYDEETLDNVAYAGWGTATHGKMGVLMDEVMVFIHVPIETKLVGGKKIPSRLYDDDMSTTTTTQKCAKKWSRSSSSSSSSSRL